jgi:hypothetical protein
MIPTPLIVNVSPDPTLIVKSCASAYPRDGTKGLRQRRQTVRCGNSTFAAVLRRVRKTELNAKHISAELLLPSI